jgi:hypothetical protein
MTRALRLLGLPDDADERAIKRAYAAKLKTTRPDEDPEGFQRLHEAYQAALAWVRSGPHDGDDSDEDWDDESDPAEDDADEDLGDADSAARAPAHAHMHAASHEDTVRPATQTADPLVEDDAGETPSEGAVVFDHDAFFDTCFRLASDGMEGDLRRWLDAQPILWSLAHKAQIGHWLLHAMHHRQPPMAPSRFDLLMDYFGLIDLRNGYDTYYLHRMRHRLQIAWELRTSQLRALAERTADDGTSVTSAVRQVRRILRDLSRPFDWPRALLPALMPMYPTAVRRFLCRLELGRLDDLPPPIDPAQVAFWDAASDRSRLTRQRLAVVGSRVAVYAALATLLYFGLAVLIGQGSPSVGAVALGAIPLVNVALVSALAMAVAWGLWTGYALFSAWQAREDDPDERRPMLRRFTIPVLLAVALAIVWIQPGGWVGAAGGLLLMSAALAAWARHRERSGPPLGRHLGYWRVFVLFVIVRTIGGEAGWMNDAGMFAAIAGLALFIWAKDLWRQRRDAQAD